MKCTVELAEGELTAAELIEILLRYEGGAKIYIEADFGPPVLVIDGALQTRHDGIQPDQIN